MAIAVTIILYFHQNYIIKREIKSDNTSNIEVLSSTDEVKDILNRYYYQTDTINVEEVVWFDFAGSGTESEFYAIYTIDGTVNRIFDVFSTSNDTVENIYYNNLGDYYQAKNITVSNNCYLVCAIYAGQLQMMNIIVLRYNGIGKAQIIYESDFYKYGDIRFVGNNVYFSGNDKLYQLVFNESICVEEIKTNKIFNTNMVHTFIPTFINGKCKIMYNDKELQFKQKHDDPFVFIIDEPIDISVGDQVFCHSISTENCYTKIMLEGVHEAIDESGIARYKAQTSYIYQLHFEDYDVEYIIDLSIK